MASTSYIIGKLVAHYGSTEAVQKAVQEIWVTGSERLMLKVDALHQLYNALPADKK